jgi:hypothetical protein
MNQSIGIPGFVHERKRDISELCKPKTSKKISKKEGNKPIPTRYRTRSYLSHAMSRAARTKNKGGPLLFSSIFRKRVAEKKVYRRHRRFPKLLENAFSTSNMECMISNLSTAVKVRKNKKRKVNIDVDVGNSLKHKPLRLNTHIWHAKRFTMVAKHGWYYPTQHNNRGLKTVDSWLEDRCMIQDTSHFTAFQNKDRQSKHSCISMHLVGNMQHLLQTLAMFMV